MFAAFTAEEVRWLWFPVFFKAIGSRQGVAMFNIEMIGTESKWGKNSAYITGYEKTDHGHILQKNLEGTGFKFYPDPYIQTNNYFTALTMPRLQGGCACAYHLHI